MTPLPFAANDWRSPSIACSRWQRGSFHQVSQSHLIWNTARSPFYFSVLDAPRATSPSIGTPRLTTLLTLREQVANAKPKFNGPADTALICGAAVVANPQRFYGFPAALHRVAHLMAVL